VRTASRRARRLGGLLLLAATVWWAFLRRRANAVRWVEPPATTLPTGGVLPAEPGAAPGELPDDVLATDAGLTELPDQAAEPEPADEVPAGTVEEAPAGTVDEARVAEILAESADADVVVVDETAYEHAVADAAAEPVAPEPAAAEPAAAEPVAAEPATPEPVAAEPVAPEPVAAEPVVAEPVVAEPVTAEPVAAADEGPAGVVEAESEVVATGPDAAEPSEETTERELAAPGVEESTVSIRPEVAEDTARGIPMPTFSEAPTAEIPAVTDDLRSVRGIGPSMERKLHELGIVSYRQLAMLDGAELERVRAELTDFRGRIEREDWVGQARALYRAKYGRDPV
jgi:predicted flap endonuclease-1-like 5' DNA nuclease